MLPVVLQRWKIEHPGEYRIVAEDGVVILYGSDLICCRTVREQVKLLRRLIRDHESALSTKGKDDDRRGMFSFYPISGKVG